MPLTSGADVCMPGLKQDIENIRSLRQNKLCQIEINLDRIYR